MSNDRDCYYNAKSRKADNHSDEAYLPKFLILLRSGNSHCI